MKKKKERNGNQKQERKAGEKEQFQTPETENTNMGSNADGNHQSKKRPF
jgi:hypothetical protein